MFPSKNEPFREAFAARETAQDWLEKTPVSANDDFVTLAQIWDFANGVLHDPSGVITKRLRTDPALSRELQAVLHDMKAYVVPRAIAASSDRIYERADDIAGFRLLVRPSSSHPEEVHVDIKLVEGFAAKTVRLFIFLEGRVFDQSIDVIDGRAHLIFEASSEFVFALTDPAAELKFL